MFINIMSIVENIHLIRKQGAIDAGEPYTWQSTRAPQEEEYVAPFSAT